MNIERARARRIRERLRERERTRRMIRLTWVPRFDQKEVERLVRLHEQNRKKCSCKTMCGNLREVYGPTMQERKHSEAWCGE